MAKDNPFAGFDVSKMMADFKVPGVDIESMLSAHKKNIEAWQKANERAAENFQSIVARQADMVRDTMGELAQTLQQISASTSPEDSAKRQTEVINRALETALNNLREIAEMTADSNREVFDVLNDRIMESMEEVRELGNEAMRKATGGAGKK